MERKNLSKKKHVKAILARNVSVATAIPYLALLRVCSRICRDSLSINLLPRIPYSKMLCNIIDTTAVIVTNCPMRM